VRRIAASAAAAALLGAVALTGSCKKSGGTETPMAAGEPARRAAQGFVHCVEGGSPDCIASGLDHSGWDAMFLLGWLASGSPTAILEALPEQLRVHGDARLVQARFVRFVELYGWSIRGAECDTVGTPAALDGMIEEVRATATGRLQRLGLWGDDLREVVDGLAGEARDGLGGGYIVQMTCRGDPFELYLATALIGERHHVVGMAVQRPAFLGGGPSDGEHVPARLASRSLGLDKAAAPIPDHWVDRWLPFGVETF
jgi:hypothetical protein